MAFRTNKVPVLQEKSASGAVATFNTALAMPLPSCKIAVNAWQEGSGTPSPSNPRPISGWDAIHIGNISDNTNINFFQGLLNGTYGFVDLGSLSWINDGIMSGVRRFNATISDIEVDNVRLESNLLCPEFTPNGSPVGGSGVDKTICHYSNKIYINDNDYSTSSEFKTAMSGVYLIYKLATPTTPTITDAQFEALCEAFGMDGQSATITIGSTVYGGEYDARTGVLTVTHGFATFDGSPDENWTNVLSAFNIIISEAEQIQTPMCNLFNPMPSRAIGYLNDLECAFTPSGAKNLNFKYSSAADLTEWKSFLADNNIQVCYELATPTTIQLPPCPIETLLGVNNVWADTGDIDLTYKDLDIAKRGNFREVFRLPS